MPSIGVSAALDGKVEVPPDHLSFHQLKDLSPRYPGACPRRWAYSRILGKQRGKANAPMIVGSILDLSMRAVFGGRMMGWRADSVRAAAVGSAERAIEAALSPDGLDGSVWPWPDDVEAWSRVIFGCLDVLIDSIKTTPVAVQSEHVWRLRCPDGLVEPMLGYSDWVEADGTITDLKFKGTPPWNGENEWDEEWVWPIRDQITVYWIGRKVDALRNGAPEPNRTGKIACVVGARNRVQPVYREYTFQITDDDEDVIIAAVKNAHRIKVADRHPARPGEHCGRCPFQSECVYDSERFAPLTKGLASA